MILLSVENVRKSFGLKPLLDGVSFALYEGQKVGVVGANGAGKTTLLRIVAGAETADSGSVVVPGGRRVAYLSQRPTFTDGLSVLDALFDGAPDELRLLHDYEEVLLALEAAGGQDDRLLARLSTLSAQMDATGGWDREAHARALLSRLGLDDVTQRVETLSGGQRKRVALARALLLRPDLLILDEPTNHLDADTVAWLEDQLAAFTGALLLVTHDRYFLDRVTGAILELDRGLAQRFEGGYTRYLEQKAEQDARLMSEEQRRQNLARRELAWLRRGAKARTTKQKARIDRAEALQVGNDRAAAQDRLALSSTATRLGTRVVDLVHVVKGFDGKTVIEDLSLALTRTTRLGVVGPNGAGKTTLLDLIAGRTTPDSGTVETGPTVVVGVYDQESKPLPEDRRVIDLVKDVAENVKVADGSVITASQMLERFLFPPATQYTPVGKLSGGERRRLDLLRLLMTGPNVLLLDEPTNDFDLATLAALEDYLDAFAGAVVVVSHDRAFLDQIAEHTLRLDPGGVVRTFPGGYTAMRDILQAEAAEAAAAASVPAPKAAPRPAVSAPALPDAPAKGKRLSNHERRELDTLEAQIEADEARKAEIADEMGARASDFAAVSALTAELDTLSVRLDAAMERWSELAERA